MSHAEATHTPTYLDNVAEWRAQSTIMKALVFRCRLEQAEEAYCLLDTQTSGRA